MKIERKENNGLVELGSLKCGDVFCIENYGYTCMKILKIVTENETSVNYVNVEDGDFGYICEVTLVKPYLNAKLVLED